MSAAAQEVIPHGRFIYAFCHVRTNQVLYSLTRTLDNSALKQLPDLGANHTPPVLRKDLWRPLYRVELPPTPNGAKQGLHALKKLREYRKLHELSWEQTRMMTRNFTDKEIETEKKKLENRGGSKKETVYDIIKRKKLKMKVKMVMDQKANSIADLAAVLLEQEALGIKTVEGKQKKSEERRAQEIEEMERLAEEAGKGGLEKIQERLATLNDILREEGGAQGQRKKLRKEHRETSRQLDKMKFAAAAVQEAKAGATPASEQGAEPAAAVAYKREDLPPFPERFDPTKRNPERMPKRGWARREILRRNAPTYTAEGVKVKWANIMDAEYAGSWPDAVQHERMGYTTRSPPLIDTETVAEYKALQWKLRRQNFELDAGTAEKVERIRAEMGLQARVDKPWKFNETKKRRSGFITGSNAEGVDLTQAALEKEEVEVVQKKAEVVVEDPNKLDDIQQEILGKIQRMATREAWDKRAEQTLRMSKDKYKNAHIVDDVAIEQQPTV